MPQGMPLSSLPVVTPPVRRDLTSNRGSRRSDSPVGSEILLLPRCSCIVLAFLALCRLVLYDAAAEPFRKFVEQTTRERLGYSSFFVGESLCRNVLHRLYC